MAGSDRSSTDREATRVLYVDDDSEFGERVVAALEADDGQFDVTIVAESDAALDRVSSESFDCVVAEYDLTGTNGFDLFERLRTRDAGCPFVVFTGAGSERVAGEALAAGVDGYVSKRDGGVETLARRVESVVEQTGSEAGFAASGRRLSLFVEQLPLGVIERDEDGRVVAVNPAAERIFGYRESELVGERVDVLLPDDGPDDAGAAVEPVSDAHGARHSVDESVRKSGERIVCEWHSQVVTDGEGGVVADVSVVQDVTERRRRIERLGEFASLVSHDLRNPLGVAEGNLDLARAGLSEGADPAAVESRLERVSDAHDRIRRLVDDLLAVTRADSGVDGAEPQSLVEVAEACWTNVDTARAALVTGTDVRLRADRGQLQRLLENLVRNAVEHGVADDTADPGAAPNAPSAGSDTDVSDPSITVTVGALPDDDGFYVADDGVGIAPERRDEVFEAGHSTTEGGTGLGLGLHIVEQVAAAHGWTVDLTESADGGARFECRGVEVVG
ncbi:MAG: PAS sensor histidine kinase [uncultured archaeon A07HB70]|nr:MAG: PAS sensor histidine kinase [uncultured archaeon A07HB70]